MRNMLPLYKYERTLCCVFGCNSRLKFKNGNSVLFHNFPLDEPKEILFKWVNAIKLPSKISEHLITCSRHFKEEDYTIKNDVKVLKPNSIPSQCLPLVWRNKFYPRVYGRLIKLLEVRGIGRLRLCFEAKLARKIRKAELARKLKNIRYNEKENDSSSDKEIEHTTIDNVPRMESSGTIHVDLVYPGDEININEHSLTSEININEHSLTSEININDHSLTSEIEIKEEPISDIENEDNQDMEETVEEMLAKMNEEPNEVRIEEANEPVDSTVNGGNDKFNFEIEETMVWDTLICNVCGDEDCEGNHREEKFECAPCRKQFKTSRQLNAHNLSHFEYRRRGHHYEKEAICKVCNVVLSSKMSLNDHMLTHSNDKNYVCMLCDKPFRQKSSLMMHIESHTINPTSHKCKMCDQSFMDTDELDKHVRKHKVLMHEYTCRECNQRFRTKQSCWAHLNSHMRAKSKPGLSCEVCGRVLSTKATLREHMFIHSGEKPFECQLCGRKIRHRANFIIHVQGHSLGQPHVCSLCGMGFAKKSELCSHTAAEHPEDRPFLCTICGMRFRNETRYFKHATTHDAHLEE